MRRKRNTEKLTDEVLGGEYNAVYRYVLSLCHDESLASDITQETFLKAMSAKTNKANIYIPLLLFCVSFLVILCAI